MFLLCLTMVARVFIVFYTFGRISYVFSEKLKYLLCLWLKCATKAVFVKNDKVSCRLVRSLADLGQSTPPRLTTDAGAAAGWHLAPRCLKLGVSVVVIGHE